MGNDDDDVGEIVQIILQPADSVDVQVVGGLVQQQDVGGAEQGTGQQRFDFVQRGHVLHFLFVQLVGDAQAGQQPRGLGFRIPAVQLGELAFEVGQLHAVFVGEIGLGAERFFFLHDGVEPGVAHDDGLQHAEFVKFIMVLLQDRQALAGGDDHFAGGRFHLAGQDFQKGRFAGAVGADQTVTVSRRELDVHILEQDAFAELQGQVLGTDHYAKTSSFIETIVGVKN